LQGKKSLPVQYPSSGFIRSVSYAVE